MDIRLAVSNTAIFLIVYGLVLGAPFYLYSIGFHLYALIMMLILASAGPFLYGYIQRRAEDKILEEQLAYLHTLKSLSKGLVKAQTLEQLSKLICESLRKIIHLSHVAFFVYHQDDEVFYLEKADGEFAGNYLKEISKDDELIKFLRKEQRATGVDELLLKRPDLKIVTAGLEAEAFVPLFWEERIVGIVVLGKKLNSRDFSEIDLDTLNYFAIQATMALEICNFIKIMADRIKEEGIQSRRDYLDGMVSTMAHEIDNPVTIIVGQTELLNMIVSDLTNLSTETKEQLKKSVDFTIEAAFRISNIIKKVEEFAKGGKGKVEPVDIYRALDGFNMIKKLIQKQNPGVEFKEEIETNLPLVLGDTVLIEEILANFCENAFHAVKFKAENEKNVHLKIFRLNGKYVRIEFSDNGYGISKDTLEKMFEVPTTTKGSSEGTGIGCYRVRQICDILGAKWGAASEGRGKGARIWVDTLISSEEKVRDPIKEIFKK